jgi:outer membrane protein OmpA-like peptidoglycan-associated protein
MDIFRIKLPIIKNPEPWVTVRGRILDGTTGEALGARIIYERLPDGKGLGISQSNPETGEYEIRLPAGELYGLRAESTDRLSENQNLDLRNITADQVIANNDFNLDAIRVATIQENASINLNNLFFDFDKAVLRPESFPELNRIVTLMEERLTLEIEIAGHTDATGPDAYNMGLSQRRATAVVQYLSGKDVPKARMKVVYFGETQPVESNDTPEGRKRNRRVEFKILKL